MTATRIRTILLALAAVAGFVGAMAMLTHGPVASGSTQIAGRAR